MTRERGSPTASRYSSRFFRYCHLTAASLSFVAILVAQILLPSQVSFFMTIKQHQFLTCFCILRSRLKSSNACCL